VAKYVLGPNFSCCITCQSSTAAFAVSYNDYYIDGTGLIIGVSDFYHFFLRNSIFVARFLKSSSEQSTYPRGIVQNSRVSRHLSFTLKLNARRIFSFSRIFPLTTLCKIVYTYVYVLGYCLFELPK